MFFARARGAMGQQRVWDPLVRTLHWTLVLAVATAWFTGEATLRLHEMAGYLALAVVIARTAWGAAGQGHARFSSFVRGPSHVMRYALTLMSGTAQRHLGHNPLGGWMVVLLMSVVSITSITGWMYTLDAFWGMAWLDLLHRALAWLLIGLIVLHVLGVLFTGWRHRENLVTAMLTGSKRNPEGDDAA